MTSTLKHQRGAIGLLAVGTLLMALMFLMLALDSGRLYLDKRKLQRIADMAALEAASRGGLCSDTGPTAVLYAQDNARLRNGFAVPAADRGLAVSCGMTQVQGARKVFVENTNGRAIRVQASERVPASLVLGGLWGERVELMAESVAASQAPIGRLAIRSTLLTLNTEQSALLNPLVGGLLGGNISLSAVSWQGIAGAEIELLRYLDLLAVDLGLTVGDYERVLSTDVGLGRLLEVAADALVQGGTAGVGLGVLGLRALALQIPSATPLLRLGDILAVQTGALDAGADVALNAFNLVGALAQLSNSKNSVAAQLPINIPGLIGAHVRLHVTEPPQISAIGDLEQARQNPLAPDSRIYVRTAQIRLLVSLDLAVVGTLTDVINDSTTLLPAVTGALNHLFDLNIIDLLVSTLSALACAGPSCSVYPVTTVQALGGGRLDVNLDVGGAEAYVTGYDCSNPASPSLEVAGRNSLAHLRIGKMGDSIADVDAKVFRPNTPAPAVEPLVLLRLGRQYTRPDNCGLGFCGNYKWRKTTSGVQTWIVDRKQADFLTDLGLTLKVDAPLVGSRGGYSTLNLNDVPNFTVPLKYYSMDPLGAGEDIVHSLSETLSGVEIKADRSQTGSILGSVVNAAMSLLSGVISLLQHTLSNLLSPLLDPIVNLLLELLGIDLANAEVGANMSCGFGARLVI